MDIPILKAISSSQKTQMRGARAIFANSILQREEVNSGRKASTAKLSGSDVTAKSMGAVFTTKEEKDRILQIPSAPLSNAGTFTSSITNPDGGQNTYIIQFTLSKQVTNIEHLDFVIDGAGVFGRIAFNIDGSVNNSASTMNNVQTNMYSSLTTSTQGTQSFIHSINHSNNPNTSSNPRVDLKEFITITADGLQFVGEIIWT